MTYVVCQTPKCQQTYPIEDFKPESVNIACQKCGGVLIDENGRANLSQNPTVIPIVTVEELEAQEEKKRDKEYHKRMKLQIESNGMNDEDISCYACRFYNPEHSLCDLNYRSLAILNERQKASECSYFSKGPFIDSDDNLLVPELDV